MPPVLTGTVTFLFSDIEGSTALLRDSPSLYRVLRAEHERLLREAFEAHGGQEVDVQGESFLVVFASAKDALLAAVEAQRSLAEHSWPGAARVCVRIGIHTGEPVYEDDHYVGLPVHHGARLVAAGHGGQILVSETTRQLLEEEELDGLTLRDLGAKRLRDIPFREHVFQVEAPGLVQQFPPLSTADRGRRRRWLVLGAAAAAAGAAVLTPLLALGGSGAVVVRPNSVAVIDPGSNDVIASIPVGTRPRATAVAAGSIWVVNAGDRTVSRIEPRRREVLRSIGAPGSAPLGSIAGGGGSVWLGSGVTHLAVSRIDPAYDAVVRTVSLGRVSFASTFGTLGLPVAFGEGFVWAAASPTGTLARLDPRTMLVTERFDVAIEPAALAVGAGSVWVSSERRPVVVRLDPETGDVVRIAVAAEPRALVVGESAVWVAAYGDDVVSKIDVVDQSVTTIRVGAMPLALAVGAGSVWIACGDGTVRRIDAGAEEVTATIEVGGTPMAVAFANGAVWTAVSPASGGG